MTTDGSKGCVSVRSLPRDENGDRPHPPLGPSDPLTVADQGHRLWTDSGMAQAEPPAGLVSSPRAVVWEDKHLHFLTLEGL